MANSKVQRQKDGLFPSKDIEVEDALKLYSWSWYRFSRSCESLNESTAKSVLAALEKKPDEGVIFLSTAIDRNNFLPTWKAAVVALKRLDSLAAFGSAEKRKQLQSIADDLRLVSGVQAACVFNQREVAKREFLAVLILDGSDNSIDALIPSLELSVKNDATSFLELKRFAAKSKTLDALFARVESAAEKQIEQSETSALAKKLGVNGLKGDLQVPFAKSESMGFLQVNLGNKRKPHVFVRFGQHVVIRDGFIDPTGESVPLVNLPMWIERECKSSKRKMDWNKATFYGFRKQETRTKLMQWLQGNLK
jgi:hypothetical protein